MCAMSSGEVEDGGGAGDEGIANDDADAACNFAAKDAIGSKTEAWTTDPCTIAAE